MNLTITALTMIYLTSSPFSFAAQTTLNHAYVSFSFNSFVFGNNQKFNVLNSKFKNFLSTVISLNSRREYYNTMYSSPLHLTECDEYYFEMNTFSGCRSSGADYGGAVSVKCADASVDFNLNCFYNCFSEQGGSLFLQCSSAALKYCYFVGSEAHYYSAMFSETKNRYLMEQVHVTGSKSAEARISSIELKATISIYFRVSSINVSVNTNLLSNTLLHADLAKDSVDSQKIEYGNFYMNSAKSIAQLDASSKSLFTFCNFIENHGTECLVKASSYLITFNKCSFMNDYSRYLADSFSDFSGCVFDLSAESIKFPPGTKMESCTFNMKITNDCRLDKMKECVKTENPRPDDSTSKNANKGAISAGVLAAIIIIVVSVIFVIYRKKCQKRGDTVPLMYV